MESVNLVCHADRTAITLSGSLDVREARAVRTGLDEALTRALPIELTASELERVDTAGLQLLLMFMRTARARGLPLEWQGVSAALAGGAELLGLADALELPK